LGHLNLAVDYIEVGRDGPARAEAAEVLRLDLQFTLAIIAPAVGPTEQARWSADLRKAGLK
jgi:hypothetical protein